MRRTLEISLSLDDDEYEKILNAQESGELEKAILAFLNQEPLSKERQYDAKVLEESKEQIKEQSAKIDSLFELVKGLSTQLNTNTVVAVQQQARPKKEHTPTVDFDFGDFSQITAPVSTENSGDNPDGEQPKPKKKRGFGVKRFGRK